MFRIVYGLLVLSVAPIVGVCLLFTHFGISAYYVVPFAVGWGHITGDYIANRERKR